MPRQRCEFILITILNICRWIASKPIGPVAIGICRPERLLLCFPALVRRLAQPVQAG